MSIDLDLEPAHTHVRQRLQAPPVETIYGEAARRRRLRRRRHVFASTTLVAAIGIGGITALRPTDTETVATAPPSSEDTQVDDTPTNTPVPTPSPIGSWTPVRLTTPDTNINFSNLDPDLIPNLTITNDGTITGTDGCNTWRPGTANWDTNSITITIGPTTRIACTPEGATFTNAISETTTWSINDNTLTLTGPTTTLQLQQDPDPVAPGDTGALEQAPPSTDAATPSTDTDTEPSGDSATPPSSEDTQVDDTPTNTPVPTPSPIGSWTPVRLTTPDTDINFSNLDPDLIPNLTITNDGTITGTDGCNTWRPGTANWDTNSITITIGPTTRIACTPEGATFTNAISETTTWSINDNTLTLTGPTTTLQLQLQQER